VEISSWYASLDFLSLIGDTPISDRSKSQDDEREWEMHSYYRLETPAADRQRQPVRNAPSG
jgi:hypothetical protein